METVNAKFRKPVYDTLDIDFASVTWLGFDKCEKLFYGVHYDENDNSIINLITYNVVTKAINAPARIHGDKMASMLQGVPILSADKKFVAFLFLNYNGRRVYLMFFDIDDGSISIYRGNFENFVDDNGRAYGMTLLHSRDVGWIMYAKWYRNVPVRNAPKITKYFGVYFPPAIKTFDISPLTELDVQQKIVRTMLIGHKLIAFGLWMERYAFDCNRRRWSRRLPTEIEGNSDCLLFNNAADVFCLPYWSKFVFKLNLETLTWEKIALLLVHPSIYLNKWEGAFTTSNLNSVLLIGRPCSHPRVKGTHVCLLNMSSVPSLQDICISTIFSKSVNGGAEICNKQRLPFSINRRYFGPPISFKIGKNLFSVMNTRDFVIIF